MTEEYYYPITVYRYRQIISRTARKLFFNSSMTETPIGFQNDWINAGNIDS